MPIYEFRCSVCDKKFEKLCRMGASDGMTCPDCGGDAAKLFSTFYSGGSSSGGCSCGGSCGGDCGGNCGNCSGECGCH